MLFTKDKDFYRSFIKLCVTLMLEQAVILSVNLVDNLMLGSYSQAALSGVAAVNQIQFILQQVTIAVNNAMIVLGSQYWGKKRLGEIRSLSSIAIRAGFAIAALFFVLVSIFPAQTLSLFTDKQDIAQQGMEYMAIIRFSYFFFACTTVMLGTARIAEQVKIALKTSIAALIVNVALNFLFIFKTRQISLFGISLEMWGADMGVKGAALATLIARIVECGLVAWHLFHKEDILKVRLSDYAHVNKVLLKDYLKVGAPLFITSTLWGFSNALQTMILGHLKEYGGIAIAAQSISNTVFQLLKVTSVGASSAAAILIGKTVGAGREDKIKEYTKTLQGMFVCIGVVLCSLLLIIRIPILNAYTEIDEATRTLANSYMIIQSFVLLTMSYQMPTNTGIIRGGGDTKFAMRVDLISIWGIVMPLSLLAAFKFNWSPIAVIICLNSDQCFKCLPAFIRVNSYKWVKKLTRKEGETGVAKEEKQEK